VKYRREFKALTGDICFHPAMQICHITSEAKLAIFAQGSSSKNLSPLRQFVEQSSKAATSTFTAWSHFMRILNSAT
jgi:hypothetical protein